MIKIAKINTESEEFLKLCDYLEENVTKENLSKNGGTLNFEKLVYNSDALFVAFDDNKPIGFNSITIRGAQYYIYQMAIKKEYQHQGIGSMFMEKLIEFVEEKNGFIVANVMDYNISSKSLISKFGFEKIGETGKGNGLYVLNDFKKTMLNSK